MKAKNQNLLYALKNKCLVSVYDVSRGLECECICPSCKSKLVAKQGAKTSWHFAHYNTEPCEYGYETSLHLLAKDILANEKRIWLPEVCLDKMYSSCNWRWECDKRGKKISEAIEVDIANVVLEKRIGYIVPDIIISTRGKEIAIEIYVTHAIDDEKLKKIKELNISTIEIDLSKHNNIMPREQLRELLIGDNKEKKWKYNKYANKWAQNFIEASEEKKVIFTTQCLYNGQVNDCPIKKRVKHGRIYSVFKDDCSQCRFLISHGGSTFKVSDDEFIHEKRVILCAGAKLISSIEDFDLSYEDRKTKYEQILSTTKSAR